MERRTGGRAEWNERASIAVISFKDLGGRHMGTSRSDLGAALLFLFAFASILAVTWGGVLAPQTTKEITLGVADAGRVWPRH